MKKIGVLISGGGTNLQALIDKQGTALKSGKIVCVCSNNSKAYGLERAKISEKGHCWRCCAVRGPG